MGRNTQYPLDTVEAYRDLMQAAVRGDRFASVAQGLGLHARAVFGA